MPPCRFVIMIWARECTLLLVGVLLACAVHRTSGYGFLHTPMGRGTVGYPNPINPDHMNNYCEANSFITDYTAKCGVCGDQLEGPRKHEVGGEYATGKITGSYKAGATIPVKVRLNSNQIGWVEFRLCPVSNPKIEVTQQCLNQNLLKFSNGETRRTVGLYENDIDMKLKLPDNVTCSQCVLQWKYYSGKKAYRCFHGKFFDCGPVLEYYNCADISISENSSMHSNPAQTTGPVTKPVINFVTKPVTKPTIKPVTQPVTKPVTQPETKPVTQPVTQPATQPETEPPMKPVTTQVPIKSTIAKSSGMCVPIGNWVKQPGMLTWCTDNCARGYCPTDMCAC